MWILGIETSAGDGEVALMQGARMAGVHALGAGGARGAGLVPACETLCRAAGIRPTDISLVAVDVGPGSFAGTRVGVTFAKTLGYASGCALAPVSSLEARAAAAEGTEGILAVALDARRGSVYAALFRRHEGHLERLLPDQLMAPADLVAALPGPVTWLGDAGPGWARPGDRIGASGAPGAAVVARLGADGGRRETPMSLAPAYLRMVEAQERRAGG